MQTTTGINNSTGPGAKSEQLTAQFVYNDTSGLLSIGMPVYKDVTDSGEFNAIFTTTALSSGGATGGRVVLGTNALAANLVCVGIYQPLNFSDKPNNGDTIRVLVFGLGVFSAAAKAAGTAVLVGDILIADSSQSSCLSGHNTYTLGKTIGVATATGTSLATGSSIIAVPGSGTTTALVNGFVKLV
jgi:hypothetical protein